MKTYPAHEPYEIVRPAGGAYFILTNQSRLFEPNRYHDRLRLFIPPGTRSVNLQAYSAPNDRPDACIGFGTPAANCSQESTGKLFDYVGGRKYTAVTREGRHILIGQEFFNPPITEEQAGWLYIRFTRPTHWRRVENAIMVDGEIYNAWRESVTWEVDVDPGYTQPVPPPAPPPDPEPDPEPEPQPEPGPQYPDITTVTATNDGYIVELVNFRLIEGIRVRTRDYYKFQLFNDGTWRR